MKCRHPYKVDNAFYVSCGRCLPCRVSQRRTWTARLMLERLAHEKGSFVTLTYSDENLPEGGNLDPEHHRLFMMRLRRRMPPKSVRFFGVGEYGSETYRPHYHYAMFGVGELDAQHVVDAWPFGHSSTLELNRATCQYVAGYTVKKLTNRNDERLKDLVPEFVRMSNRPGIGALALPTIIAELKIKKGQDFVKAGGVPHLFRMHGKKYSFGRYLMKKLHEGMETPESVIEEKRAKWLLEQATELFELREKAQGRKDAYTTTTLLNEASEGSFRQMKAKQSRERRKL